MGILWFGLSFIFNLPLLLVGQFGFNFYLNGIILNGTELLVFPFSFTKIDSINRKTTFMISIVTCLVCGLVLIFVGQNNICTHNCSVIQSVVQIGLLIVIFYCASIILQILVVYTFELYPIQIAAIGIGFGQFSMGISNIIIPTLIVLFNSLNLSIMIVFCFMAGVFLLALFPLPETLGVEHQHFIKELE